MKTLTAFAVLGLALAAGPARANGRQFQGSSSSAVAARRSSTIKLSPIKVQRTHSIGVKREFTSQRDSHGNLLSSTEWGDGKQLRTYTYVPGQQTQVTWYGANGTTAVGTNDGSTAPAGAMWHVAGAGNEPYGQYPR